MFQRWISLPVHKSCLIIGPGRSGKTTLFKQRYPGIPYATLDELDLLDWAKQDPKGFISRLGDHAVIDEIQRHPTAKKYLNALQQTQLTFKLYGYQYGPAKRFVKAAKIYVADTGIFSRFNSPVSQGQRIENFVIAEL